MAGTEDIEADFGPEVEDDEPTLGGGGGGGAIGLGKDEALVNTPVTRGRGKEMEFESVVQEEGENGPARSVEGYIIIVRNVHEEAQEEDMMERFAEFGQIKNMHMNLDRRTGFVKGYCFVEYERFTEAGSAIKNMNGQTFMGKVLAVDWAFAKGPIGSTHSATRKR
eukprot:gnl/Hemi2/14363_TR4866_c0_g1_i1.p1 gnl/Hemi2/14363_TR4866_c0_g1~~gnl/Hemi2/14363_TR4866_c0_g1_i1.p1  ORF type:complete len:192 (+),score=57.11 gnl/Hemi2/14363_TR4866_c0_g1_i1:81-578(+)